MTLKVTFRELLSSVEGFSVLRNVPVTLEQHSEGNSTTSQATDRGFLVRHLCQLPALSKSGEIICGFSDHTSMPGYCKSLAYKLAGVKPCS